VIRTLGSSLYSKLPPLLQNVAISSYGVHWRSRRFGGVFRDELMQTKRREEFANEEWEDFLTGNLRQMVSHAFETVPFYYDSFRRAGVKSSDLQKIQFSELQRLPVLEKNDLRTFGKNLMLSKKLESGGAFFSSSGSTGTPTQILFSHPMHQRWSAGFEARIRHWAGVDRFMPRGMIGGRRVVPDGIGTPPFYRYNYFEKQTYFSAYHISAHNAADYLRGMEKHGVQYMTGYAMSNFFLARFLQEANLKAPELKAVITSSEKLTESMRHTFQQVYNCKTYDSWSGVEACGLVSECEHGSLHVSPDMGIIELLDVNDNPVKPGEVGEVVCTGLLNFDQPLIRYRIGDLMRLGAGPCGCGRNMPVIAEIIGRVEDTVVGKDGREMVRFHGIFVDLPNLFEGQIIQQDLDTFHVNVVTNDKFTAKEEMIIVNRMNGQLGNVDVIVNRVPHIPRNPNGKFKAVISHVKRSPINTNQG
jgi:phenylacetate-CoA ligase